MNQILNLRDLKIGRTYIKVSLFSESKVALVSRDTTNLNRDIAYFVYLDRVKKIPTEAQVKRVLEGKESNPEIFQNLFSVWGFQLETSALLYELPEMVRRF